MKGNYIGQAWLVLALALCFGAALAGVNTALKAKIDANKLADTVGQIPNLVPGAASGKADFVGGEYVYRAFGGDGEQVGWVLPALGQGFADRIELLVGLDKDAGKVTGLYILYNQETPGLGNKITEDTWRGQFGGKPAEPALAVTKGKAQKDNEVEAITGATISSESVVGIVNQGVAKFRGALKEL
ncbi:MAG: FMN-binding protein [Chloroflexota bacterium]